MAWGTPTSLGSVSTNVGATSLTLTGVTASAGDEVTVGGVIMKGAAGALTVTVTDSAGNTYVPGPALKDFQSGSGTVGFIAGCVLASPLSGGSITITLSGGANWTNAAFGAAKVSGGATSSFEDAAAEAHVNAAATTSPTITSGTPGTAGDMFWYLYANAGSTADTYTEDAGHGWTNLFSKVGNTSCTFSMGYQVNAGTGTLIHNPTTTSRGYVQCIVAFKVGAGGFDRSAVGTVTLAGVTPAATGALPIKANGALTLSGVARAATGALTLKAAATATLGAVTRVGSGKLIITAAESSLLAAIAQAATGSGASDRNASAVQTLTGAARSATCKLIITGQA